MAPRLSFGTGSWGGVAVVADCAAHFRWRSQLGCVCTTTRRLKSDGTILGCKRQLPGFTSVGLFGCDACPVG